MELSSFGRLFLIIGAIFIALGILFNLLPRLPGVGRLPGDILVRRDGSVFYFPLATSILVSLLLTLILNLILRR